MKSRIEESLNSLVFKILSFQEARFFVSASENMALTKINMSLEGGQLSDKEIRFTKSYGRLEAFLKENNRKIEEHYYSILFTDLVASVELFFADIIKIVLQQHPKKMPKSSFTLAEIVESEGIEMLVDKAANQFIYKLMYNKPEQYLNELCDVLSIDKEILKDCWPIWVEAKARRDVGVHNGWICNETYLRKIQDLQHLSKTEIGDSLLPVEEKYFSDVLTAIASMANSISESIIAKYS